MQLFRRSAFRAINSSIASPRTITTRAPFAVRSKPLPLSSTLFRRFASNDVGSETQEPSADTSKSDNSLSADKEDSSSIRSAIESATDTASTYASDVADSAAATYESAKESVTDYAQAAGAAAGFSAPRQDRNGGDHQERKPYGRRGDDRPSRPKFELTPNKSIYVGNLLFDCTEQDLKTEFSPFGDISDVLVATDLRGLSKGFAYITFASTQQATAAIQAKHQQLFEGRRLIVNYQNSTKREYEKNEPSNTLFIGNLAFEMSDADLTKLFKDIRNVVDVRVAIDRRTGQPRGFAHAEFTDIASAQKGMEVLSGKEVYNRALRVDFSGGGSKREGGGDDRFGGRGERRGGRGGRSNYGQDRDGRREGGYRERY